MIGLTSSVVQRKITPQYSVAYLVTVQCERPQLFKLQSTDIFQNYLSQSPAYARSGAHRFTIRFT